jgi:eukaryotic-like serine/threonine-protein kinase
VTQPEQIKAGDVLDGKYRIEKQIGAGGMGAVYMATHAVIGRRAAIKTLHLECASDPQVVARFHREAQLAGSIGHDNICEVIDIGTLPNGAPYLVMPLLNGQALADLLENNAALSLERVADIGSQTLSALEAAHGAGIVHRDLKPDNIFVTKMGDRRDFVKLLDFGISKIIEQDEVTHLTMTGTVLGTPFYMAPEQAKGAKNLDHRVDIYAMGVILYEALTGRRPFEGDTYNEIMFRIIAEPFTLPTALNPSIPAAIEAVILKAMSREAGDRFPDASAMRAALEAAARGEAVDFSERMSTAPTVAGVSSVHGKTPMSASYTQGPRVTSVTVPSKRGLKIGIAVGAVVVLGAAAGAFLFLGGGPQPAPQIVLPPIAPPPVVAAPVPAPVPVPVPVPVPEPVLTAPPPPQPSAAGAEVAATAQDPKESGAAKTGKRKKRDGDKTDATATSKDKKDAVKGRFGTSFVSDYE